MKKTLLIFLIALLSVSVQQLKAQKYFVYDGDAFSVMFVCNNENTTINEIDFSYKNSSGEWKWSKFEIYDYSDFDNPDYLDSLFTEADDEMEKGFIYYCKDSNGNRYAVDYYRDSDYVLVYPIDEKGNVGKTQWKMTRRQDTK